MNLYRQSIALFGFVLPVFVALILVVVGLMIKGKTTQSFNGKCSHFKGFEQDERMASELEKEIGNKRRHIELWEELISHETASTVSSNLRSIEDQLPNKEFQTTGQQFPTSRNGFASVSEQESTQVRLAFRATFRAMQHALIALETRMPQLQLQDLKMAPSNNSNTLNFDVNYTAWER
jgi:hypothetical protein